jgi:haloalkane dehalogenase
VERPDWVDGELYPFEDRWAEANGCTVHYVDEGSGPPLLMLHGNPTWSFTWREVIDGVKSRYRCIAPDLPGFGLSKQTAPGYAFRPQDHARTIEEFVAELDLRDVTLLVQDWGGPIGFAAAALHPGRFAAFVIATRGRGRSPIPGRSCSRGCSAARSGGA